MMLMQSYKKETSMTQQYFTRTLQIQMDNRLDYEWLIGAEETQKKHSLIFLDVVRLSMLTLGVG
jgi:hypothetical protein